MKCTHTWTKFQVSVLQKNLHRCVNNGVLRCLWRNGTGTGTVQTELERPLERNSAEIPASDSRSAVTTPRLLYFQALELLSYRKGGSEPSGLAFCLLFLAVSSPSPLTQTMERGQTSASTRVLTQSQGHLDLRSGDSAGEEPNVAPLCCPAEKSMDGPKQGQQWGGCRPWADTAAIVPPGFPLWAGNQQCHAGLEGSEASTEGMDAANVVLPG